MDTKKKILDVALTLFSEKGYGNVYVGQIAEGVGIKAPSLYKHYKSKRDIFEAILEEMRNRYDKETEHLNMSGDDFTIDFKLYKNISEDELVKMGIGLFSFFLHDEYECKLCGVWCGIYDARNNSWICEVCKKRYKGVILTAEYKERYEDNGCHNCELC